MTKISYLLLAFALVFTACQSSGGGNNDQVATLEKEVAANATPENTMSLINAYVAQAEATDDANMGADFLLKAATLHQQNNRFSNAVELLKQALKNHYTSAKTPEIIGNLANIYTQKLRSPENATTAIQAGLAAFPNATGLASLKANIPADTAPLEERIPALGTKMYNEEAGRIDFRMANDFMTSSELYALILPKSPEAPEYLHKAGETARSVRNFPKAMEYYEIISNKYADSDKAPQALFLRAFTLDNDLGEADKARPLYEEFLQKYPNDDFADDTKFLLENLGKSDDEIIQSFEQK